MNAGYTAPGWVRDAEGRLKRETKPHMGRRLPGFDYRRPGCYVVTIVLADRREGKLGELVVRRKPSACVGGANETGAGGVCGTGSDGAWLSVAEARAQGLKPDEIEAKIVFSALGRAIFAHFRRMGEFTHGLRPVYCAVMPDHLHLLVEIVAELERPLGNAIGGFKTGCEKIYAKMDGEGRLFAPGFVDEIVLRAGQLSAEFDYLVDNPRRLAIKRLFPELFKVSREIRVNFRLAPKGQVGSETAPKGQVGLEPASIGLGRDLPKGSSGEGVPSAPAAQAVGRFSAIGNHFLLMRPHFHQIQVSRRFFVYARDPHGKLLKDAPPAVATPEFAEKLEVALAAAKRGAVLVSPCISQGEREIARRAFAAGYRVITLANRGFSPLYKPGGKLFETCAAGNLLLLAPVGWPYQPAERTMTRVDALVLNRIAQLIAGDDACEIDYKGATLVNVDEEVKRVV